MRTLKQQRDIIEIQYILECFAEDYQIAENESDKYYLQLTFIDFVIDNIQNPSSLLKLMMLQEDKFKPFISCLKNVDLSSNEPRKKSLSAFKQSISGMIIMCPME